MPSGLKNKTVILDATTTTKVKIDHTKRPLLTHMPPPRASAETLLLFGWGRGSHQGKNVALEECLLFERCKMYQGTKKRNKTNMIKWTSLRLTPIKFGI